ncbi:hypothetical protein TIFTF001_039662 [Ficus carica]|uniref:Uncharacterized protein n=1 Tax=Ficus carica TaxID=3494 RepID=A0AA87ZXJ3_FICCA|nr:hypothetical protein TIFTF001_044516 [Ficus carica]GMN54914.1 hypothetical protein TIFTF001_024028 [Ficus carica]GMN67122.1 hypothetical protein TIFTF001_036189 [Ficus carica]GMN70620.1 hypothetical protein TIFTF001_039662 [Ficus carica]
MLGMATSSSNQGIAVVVGEVAGSKPKRNLELVIEMSCDASRARKVACRAEGGWEKALSLVVGFGVWQTFDEKAELVWFLWTKKPKNTNEEAAARILGR